MVVGLHDVLEDVDLQVGVADHADLDSTFGEVLDKFLGGRVDLRGETDNGQKLKLVLPLFRKFLNLMLSGCQRILQVGILGLIELHFFLSEFLPGVDESFGLLVLVGGESVIDDFLCFLGHTKTLEDIFWLALAI